MVITFTQEPFHLFFIWFIKIIATTVRHELNALDGETERVG